MSDSEKPDDDEPKLVVDTDWKEQVAREKEAAMKSSSAESDGESSDDGPANPESDNDQDSLDTPATADSSEVTDSAAAHSKAADGDYPAPPPATFDMLISMLFTQAMAMLGQVPDPSTGETTVNKPYAKHFIETLEMLSEKTKGNLSDDEKKMLSEALHALRMMYVNAKKS